MLQPEKKSLQIKTLKNLSLLVGVVRFELTTPCSQSRCAKRIREYLLLMKKVWK